MLYNGSVYIRGIRSGSGYFRRIQFQVFWSDPDRVFQKEEYERFSGKSDPNDFVSSRFMDTDTNMFFLRSGSSFFRVGFWSVPAQSGSATLKDRVGYNGPVYIWEEKRQMGKGRKVSAATYPAYFYHFLSVVKATKELRSRSENSFGTNGSMVIYRW